MPAMHRQGVAGNSVVAGSRDPRRRCGGDHPTYDVRPHVREVDEVKDGQVSGGFPEF
jgi:hypothetical protein